MFPTGQPTDEEFDEIVEYAIEGRRRVKEQLNKRKPDEEYAHINMSYINKDGQKVVVYCPESKYSIATQNPRKDANVHVLTEPAHDNVVTTPVTANVEPEITPNHVLSDIVSGSETVEDGSLKEKRLMFSMVILDMDMMTFSQNTLKGLPSLCWRNHI